MKPFIIVCAVVAALGFARVGAAQSTHHADSKTTDLHLSEPLVVGTTTLKPGEYTFQCKTVGEESFLIVTDQDRKEVARVPCTAENLPEKVKTSEFRSRTLPDGQKTLTAVRIKGETIAHRVTVN